MFSLRLLGGLAMKGPDGPVAGRVAHPRQLAVLARLAVSSTGTVSREKLTGCFWPDKPQARARHLLADITYLLRKELGESAILSVGKDLRLDPAIVRTDVDSFERALAEDDFERAIEDYSGPFLDGFYLSGAANFEKWVDVERARLARRFSDALEQLGETAEATGDWSRAVAWWEQRAAQDPFDSGIARRLMSAQVASGSTAKALEHARLHESRLQKELGLHPNREFRAFVAELQAQELPRPDGVGESPPLPHPAVGGSEASPAAPATSEEPGAGEAPKAHVRAASTDRTVGALWRNVLVGGAAVGLVFVLAGLMPDGTDPGGDESAGFSGPMQFSESIAADPDVHLGGATDGTWGVPGRTSLDWSPKGNLLVYAARVEESSQLYLRRMATSPEGEPMAGTEGGESPFFSADGVWIGFFRDSSLMKISVDDRTVQTIQVAATAAPRDYGGASWGDDGTIIYATSRGLHQVGGEGGTATLLVEVDPDGGRFPRFAQPHVLPGSSGVLYHAMPSGQPAEAEIRALDLDTNEEKTLLRDAMHPRYVGSGHLLFARRGTLMAIRFDPDRLEVRGDPLTVSPSVMQAIRMPNSGWETGAAQFAVSRTGHLAYAAGGMFPALLSLPVRITSSDTVPIGIKAGAHSYYRVNRASDRIAFHGGMGNHYQIRVYDIELGQTQVLTTGGYFSRRPVWSPDGAWLAFDADGDSPITAIYKMPADGSGPQERLVSSRHPQQMSDWSVDGTIAYLERGDIWILPPRGRARPFFTSDATEADAHFSPDGRWLAYVSDRSGQREVYVRPFPGPGPSKQVSSDGGRNPAWLRDGSGLLYLQPPPDVLSPHNVLMSVDVTLGDSFESGRPERIRDPANWGRTPVRGYDVFDDGSIITTVPVEPRAGGRPSYAATTLQYHLNLVEDLRRRLPH